MPQRDAHKYSMGTVDLSKQPEKGHKRYSCLIYIFPPGNIGAEGHSQKDGVTFLPTAQQLPQLRLPAAPRARPALTAPWWVHELEELRSHEPTLPSCDSSQASNLSPLPLHQKGTRLFSKEVPTSSRQKNRLFSELSKSQKLLNDNGI